jgi:hypothetical protein
MTVPFAGSFSKSGGDPNLDWTSGVFDPVKGRTARSLGNRALRVLIVRAGI